MDSANIYSCLFTHDLYLYKKLPWYYIELEVVMAVKMLMLVFGVVTLCGLVGRYQLQLWRWRWYVSPKHYLPDVHTVLQHRIPTSTRSLGILLPLQEREASELVTPLHNLTLHGCTFSFCVVFSVFRTDCKHTFRMSVSPVVHSCSISFHTFSPLQMQNNSSSFCGVM
jgi:hypothetical protein